MNKEQIIDEKINSDIQNDAMQKHLEEVERMLNYACKEGFLDPNDVSEWTQEQKESYFNECQAYEPNED